MKYPAVDTYESNRNAALRKIKSAAEDSDNPILKEISKEEDPKQKAERDRHIRAMEMVMYKGMEMYREGKCSKADCISNLCEALKAIK